MESQGLQGETQQLPRSNYRNSGDGHQLIQLGQGPQNTNTGAGIQFNGSIINVGHARPQNETNGDVNFFRDLFVTDAYEDREALKRKKGRRVAGTCEWMIDNDKLNDWLNPELRETRDETPPNILWFYGYPGKGKSTMAIYLTEKLSDAFSPDTKKALAYFFCDSSVERRNTAQSILRGLLWQLFRQYPELLSDRIRENYQHRGRELFESFDALWGLLMDIATKSNHHVFCIIDGLDECEKESEQDLLNQIQATFEHVNPAIKLSMLILSRPHDDIRESLSQYRHQDLSLLPQLRQDVARYIDHQLDHLSKYKRYSKSTKSEVKMILEAKAEGTFLWVGLACQDLRRVLSKDAIRFLQGLPEGLSAQYSRILSGLLAPDEDDADTVKRILGFVAVSLRPLTLLELSDACQLHLDQDEETRMQSMRDYISKFRLIVVVTTERNGNQGVHSAASQPSTSSRVEKEVGGERVVLLHQSVKDFLFDSWTENLSSERELHAITAYRCLDELIWHLPSRRTDIQSSGYFLPYAIQYWHHQARSAGDRFEVQVEHAEFFAVNSYCRQAWLSHMDYRPWLIESSGSQLSVLNIAGRWQILPLVDYVFSGRQQVGSVPPNSQNRFLDAVLDADAGGGLRGRIESPLVDAIASGCVQTLSRFLNTTLPLTACTIRAAAYSEHSKEMVQTLLNSRKDEVLLSEDLTCEAASCLDAEAMRLLLEHPDFKITKEIIEAAVVNKKHGAEVMALLRARHNDDIDLDESLMGFIAENSSVEIMDILLCQPRNRMRITSKTLEKAALNLENGPEMMEFLLIHGPDDIRITEELLLAATTNPERCVDILAALLAMRPEVKITERALLEALAVECVDYAGEEENVKMLELLFSHQKFEINEKVLIAAAENSWNMWDAIPWLLARGGKDVKITERVLEAAACCSPPELFLRLLKEVGDDVKITEKMLAATVQNDTCGAKLMHLLLNYGDEPVEISDQLVEAVLQGPNSYVKDVLLRKRGAEIKVTKESLQAWLRNDKTGFAQLEYLLNFKKDDFFKVLHGMSGNELTEVKERYEWLRNSDARAFAKRHRFN
ncbi:hypothetical protein EDB80DRAFT_718896 [Ilyonectria destructans]|nr:hypothetical protein EDB80DRAFT_718896 [Ilyonectria destructans]